MSFVKSEHNAWQLSTGIFVYVIGWYSSGLVLCSIFRYCSLSEKYIESTNLECIYLPCNPNTKFLFSINDKDAYLNLTHNFVENLDPHVNIRGGSLERHVNILQKASGCLVVVVDKFTYPLHFYNHFVDHVHDNVLKSTKDSSRQRASWLSLP